MSLLINSFKADVYVFNWLENIGKAHLKYIQFIIVVLSLYIIIFRRRKIVWMYHNVNPHNGENLISNIIGSYLSNHSNLIISHSEEGMIKAKIKAEAPVLYRCHPMEKMTFNKCHEPTLIPDIFIWGSIYSYKGIPEFLKNVGKTCGKKIMIIGKCIDKALEYEIRSLCDNNICYINKRADYDEIATYCLNSKCVLFPYVGDSISSSGALIDTIAMGGIPIGPSMGAFVDLSKEGLCYVYKNYEELAELINDTLVIEKKDREEFLNKNSWEEFAKYFVLEVGA